MGLFGYTQEEINQAYAKGVQEAKEEGLFSWLGHGFANLLAEPFMDEAAKAHERGRNDYHTGNTD